MEDYACVEAYRATAIVVDASNYKRALSGVALYMRQFSKSFSTPLLSCQLHQTTFVYTKQKIRDRMPYTACRNTSDFMGLRISAEMG